MRKKLILISGSPCVGKTAVGEKLFESYDNSAYLDGDGSTDPGRDPERDYGGGLRNNRFHAYLFRGIIEKAPRQAWG